MNTRRRTLDRALAELSLARRQVGEERARLKGSRAALSDALAVREVAQAAALAVQTRVHAQVDRVVTRCLRAVGFDYDFRIKFSRKRGRTDAELLFVRNGIELNPLREAEQGAVDVAALALRLAVLLLSTPKRERVVVLDEPAKSIHGKDHRERFAELLPVLAKELHCQFILSTGLEWLKIGKVIDLEE